MLVVENQILLPPINAEHSISQLEGSGGWNLAKFINGTWTSLASNSGSGVADNNTIFIADPISSNTHFIVNSIQFNPSAPVNSGLTANSSNYSYSLDGGATYGSTQTTVITHFKVAPQGVFLAPSGSGSPAFTVKYRVTVD